MINNPQEEVSEREGKEGNIPKKKEGSSRRKKKVTKSENRQLVMNSKQGNKKIHKRDTNEKMIDCEKRVGG